MSDEMKPIGRRHGDDGLKRLHLHHQGDIHLSITQRECVHNGSQRKGWIGVGGDKVCTILEERGDGHGALTRLLRTFQKRTEPLFRHLLRFTHKGKHRNATKSASRYRVLCHSEKEHVPRSLREGDPSAQRKRVHHHPILVERTQPLLHYVV